MLRGWNNRHFIALILVLLSLATHAQYGDNVSESIKLESIQLDNTDNISLVAHSQILEDSQSEFTWQQVMASNAWAPIETPDLNLGITKSSFWFKTKVQYIENHTRFFEIRYPLLDYVDFFILKDNQLIKHVETGDSRPFNSRELKNKNFVISHHQDNNKELTLLIRAQTSGSMVLPLSTVNVERYAQEISLENITHGVYFGISIAMFLYNLMLFVYLKERSYLYYCLFVFIVFLSALAYTGQGFYRLWPEYEWLNRYMTPVASAGGFLAATMFFGSFLQLNHRGVWGRRVLLACIVISVISVMASLLLSYSQSIQILVLIQLLLTVLYLGSSTYLWKTGVLEAKYFTFAWVFFIAGNSINAARVLGVIPSNMFTVYANLYGNAVEMLMLSVGLAYRFETMREIQIRLSRELRLAQQSAIKNLEKYKDLFQKSPVGLFRYERKNNQFFNNEKANALINKYEDIQEFLQDRLTFSDYKNLLASDELKDIIIKYDGEKYYNLSLLVIRDEYGAVVEIEGSLLDVSEQKQAEILRLASEQEKLNSLTQLVIGISHQFNTPLGVMVTTEDLIKDNLLKISTDLDEGCLKKDELSEALNMITEAMVLVSKNTRVMSSMLKDLRHSIDTRKDLNFTNIITDCFFKDLLGYFKAQIKENNSTFLLDINVTTNGINTLCSDYDVLSDVILRLYGNTYCHAYSAEIKEGLITINLSEDDNYICIEYSDNGRGLSEAEQENIFVPFFTGKNRKKGSSGLGMYILHNQIVKILLGTVELKPFATGFSINIYLPKK
ncbi:MAG: signal transduction histidine kinase [Oleispira sp.]|jgi:signal transduction histidine kinase